MQLQRAAHRRRLPRRSPSAPQRLQSTGRARGPPSASSNSTIPCRWSMRAGEARSHGVARRMAANRRRARRRRWPAAWRKTPPRMMQPLRTSRMHLESHDAPLLVVAASLAADASSFVWAASRCRFSVCRWPSRLGRCARMVRRLALAGLLAVVDAERQGSAVGRSRAAAGDTLDGDPTSVARRRRKIRKGSANSELFRERVRKRAPRSHLRTGGRRRHDCNRERSASIRRELAGRSLRCWLLLKKPDRADVRPRRAGWSPPFKCQRHAARSLLVRVRRRAKA